MFPIAPVILAIVITALWSKEMWGQDPSKAQKEEKKPGGKKLVVYLEDEDAGARAK